MMCTRRVFSGYVHGLWNGYRDQLSLLENLHARKDDLMIISYKNMRAKLIRAGFLAKLLLSVRSWWKKLRACRLFVGSGCSTSDVKRSASCLDFVRFTRRGVVGWV